MSFWEVDPAWYWLVAAGLLAITELAVPGVFLVWLAGAALLTGIVTLITGIALPAQLAIFGIGSIVMVLAGRQAYSRMSHSSDDPLLNDRSARMVGQIVTVDQAIENGQGRVRVGDGVWMARGPDAPQGARVRVTGTQGSCLIVETAELLPGPDGA